MKIAFTFIKSDDSTTLTMTSLGLINVINYIILSPSTSSGQAQSKDKHEGTK